jgi:chitinase
MTPWVNADLAFCCNSKSMGQVSPLCMFTVSAGLANVTERYDQSTSGSCGPFSITRSGIRQEKLDIKLDKTMGGQRDRGNSNNPDDHAFGFYIMSGGSRSFP